MLTQVTVRRQLIGDADRLGVSTAVAKAVTDKLRKYDSVKLATLSFASGAVSEIKGEDSKCTPLPSPPSCHLAYTLRRSHATASWTYLLRMNKLVSSSSSLTTQSPSPRGGSRQGRVDGRHQEAARATPLPNLPRLQVQGGVSRHSLPQGMSVTAARAWQAGTGRLGCGSRRLTGLWLALRDSVLAPPR